MRSEVIRGQQDAYKLLVASGLLVVHGHKELPFVRVAAIRDRTVQDRVVLAHGGAGEHLLGFDARLRLQRSLDVSEHLPSALGKRSRQPVG